MGYLVSRIPFSTQPWVIFGLPGLAVGMVFGWLWYRWTLRSISSVWAKVIIGLGAIAIVALVPPLLMASYYLIRFRSLRDADCILPATVLFFCRPAMLGTALSYYASAVRRRYTAGPPSVPPVS